MKFTIETKEMINKLDLMNGVIPNKHNIPSFTNINVKVKEDKIIFIGCDGDMSVKSILTESFEVEEIGEVLINCSMLKSILTKLQGSTTSFYIKDSKLCLDNLKSHYTLNIQAYEDYPKIEFKELENKVEMSKTTLGNIINKCMVSCSTNDRRPILTGVNICIDYNYIKAVATDSFRLSQYKINADSGDDININFTLPKNSLLFIQKMITKTKLDSIKVLYDTKNILIQFEDTLFQTRLLDGNYPQTDKIIPTSFDNKIYFDKNEMLGVIDRLSVLKSNNKSDKEQNGFNIIILTFDKNTKELVIKNRDNGIGSAKETINNIKINYMSCDKLTIAFNSQYLFDSIKTFNDDELAFNITNNKRPFTITSENELENIQLLLPVMVEE